MCIMSQRDLEEIPAVRAVENKAVHKFDLPLSRILKMVASTFNVSVSEIESNRRNVHIMRPRQAYYWLAVKTTGFSYPTIARKCGFRDHTTVMYGVKAAEKRRNEDPEFRKVTDSLKTRLGA